MSTRATMLCEYLVGIAMGLSLFDCDWAALVAFAVAVAFVFVELERRMA